MPDDIPEIMKEVLEQYKAEKKSEPKLKPGDNVTFDESSNISKLIKTGGQILKVIEKNLNDLNRATEDRDVFGGILVMVTNDGTGAMGNSINVNSQIGWQSVFWFFLNNIQKEMTVADLKNFRDDMIKNINTIIHEKEEEDFGHEDFGHDEY